MLLICVRGEVKLFIKDFSSTRNCLLNSGSIISQKLHVAYMCVCSAKDIML